MTFEQLRIFVAVAERLHFTQAATALNLTQSAVSASVASLEGQYGVRLFHRVGRSIELSEAGRVFLAEARQVLARTEAARTVLQDFAQEPRGRLRVHASQTVASYWLPPILVGLYERYQSVDLQLTVGNTAQVARAVLEGSADIGFVEGAVEDDALRKTVVAHDQLVIALRQGHPWSGRARVDPADYREQAWILREAGSGTRSEFERHLDASGQSIADLDNVVELPSNEAILTAVAATSCVTVLSERAVAHASGVVTVPIDNGERPFFLLWHPARYRTRAMEALFAACGVAHA